MADPSPKEIPTQETWKDIKGYEGCYQVSDLGRVKSLERMIQTGSNTYRRRERILSQGGNRTYLKVILCDNQDRKDYTVHRLVALSFLGNPPTKQHQVNHIDGNKLNNHVTNLEWVTVSYNNHHAWVTGLKNQDGEKNPQAKLKNSDVLNIKQMLSSKNYTNRYIAKMYSVSEATICLIKTGKVWGHL